MLSHRRSFVGLLLVCPGASGQDEAAAPLGWNHQARAEIRATTIVRGELRIRDPSALQSAIERGGAYVELQVGVRETLKGPHQPEHRLLFFAAPAGHPHGYSPHAEDVQALIGRSCIVMLQRVGDQHFLADRFHGVALAQDTDEARARTGALIALHEQRAGAELGAELPFTREVALILEQVAADPSNEELGFVPLQALGLGAVPAIVRHLDDDRPLRGGSASLLRRHPTRREAMLELAAERFGDVLFVVLQQLTGESFGFEVRSADDPARASAGRAWRIYAQYVLADQRLQRFAGWRPPR